MLAITVLLIAAATVRAMPFEIASNKPFVPVTIGGSAPQWFILDTGNNGGTIIARECADRIQLQRGDETKVQFGAGAGADVGLAQVKTSLTLGLLGDSLTVAAPRVVPLGHVARVEGRRVDGAVGLDYLAHHIVEIDYARGTITVHDSASYEPPAGAAIVPLELDTGWAIVVGTVTPHGGSPIPCRLIIDTGVRFTIGLFRPFADAHGLRDAAGTLHDAVVGTGFGGVSRGDVSRLDALALGSVTFARPVAVLSRDTTGVFSLDQPQGIVGGELLRRHRTTFDYPHGRMILEPYPKPAPFEYDMSGVFLATDAPEYTTIRILSVGAGTPAAEAGLRPDDEIVSIDGSRTPGLKLDQARALLRTPGSKALEIRRGDQTLRVRLQTRRLV